MGNICCTRSSIRRSDYSGTEQLDSWSDPDGVATPPQHVVHAWRTVEEAVQYLKRNFRDTVSLKVEDSSRFVKLKLIETHPHHFDGNVKLSLPHRSDAWTKPPDYRHLGVHIVATHIVDGVSPSRWLVYVDEDEITLVERTDRVRSVKPSALLVNSPNVI
jgi:hypothetical protein